MWKRFGPLLFLLSIALNLGVAGVWGAHALRGYRSARQILEAESEGVWYPVHRSLGVTQEQWKLLEPGLIRFQVEAESICSEIHRRRDELIELIAAPQPDRAAILDKQEEIREVQKRMQKLVIEHLLSEKAVLTAPQQEQLFDMIRQRSGIGGPHGLLRHTPPAREAGQS